MKTLTQKQIKQTNAKDITTTTEDIKGLICIAKSFGIYGMNGGLFEDKQGDLYKVIARSSNLFKYC